MHTNEGPVELKKLFKFTIQQGIGTTISDFFHYPSALFSILPILKHFDLNC